MKFHYGFDRSGWLLVDGVMLNHSVYVNSHYRHFQRRQSRWKSGRRPQPNHVGIALERWALTMFFRTLIFGIEMVATIHRYVGKT